MGAFSGTGLLKIRDNHEDGNRGGGLQWILPATADGPSHPSVYPLFSSGNNGARKRLICTSFTSATVYAEAIIQKNGEYSGKIKIAAGGNN